MEPSMEFTDSNAINLGTDGSAGSRRPRQQHKDEQTRTKTGEGTSDMRIRNRVCVCVCGFSHHTRTGFQQRLQMLNIIVPVNDFLRATVADACDNVHNKQQEESMTRITGGPT
jgi:hypothetical protein